MICICDGTPERVLSCLRCAIYSRDTLVWAVGHACDGDPIPDAWARCDDVAAMHCLLRDAELEAGARWRILDGLSCRDHDARGRVQHGCVGCLVETRRAYPTLTLERVLESLRATEGT